MNIPTWLTTLTAILTFTAARAEVFSELSTNFIVGTDIPEANPVGLVSRGFVTGLPVGALVTNLTVSLDVSGGYNGSLYAYLVAPNDSTVVLLDQPGVTEDNPFGAGGSGLAVNFTESAGESIQTAAETPGEVTAGNYLPAGDFSNCQDTPADGEWKLYVSDETAGGGQAILVDWSLTLKVGTVPEPCSLTLVLGASLALGACRRWARS